MGELSILPIDAVRGGEVPGFPNFERTFLSYA